MSKLVSSSTGYTTAGADTHVAFIVIACYFYDLECVMPHFFIEMKVVLNSFIYF